MKDQPFQVSTIHIDQLVDSPNNPRGKVIKDDAFKDLVASIKEKGILVPLIVRPLKGGKHEIVAGHRRTAAARAAGIVSMPCQVRELSDDEAAELAIIENLQRSDVHPIDEGEAYRKLHEDRSMELKDIAVHVGKDLKYVKQRLFLTNLIPDMRSNYRVGRMKDSQAALIARLAPTDQRLAFKAMTQMNLSAPDLGDWIKEHLYQPLNNQPWLESPELREMIGPCTSCPPQKDGLFEMHTAGACVELKCWQQKMAKYINWIRERHPEYLLVTEEYGDAPGGVLTRGKWVELNKRTKCELAQNAIVMQGARVGSVILACGNPECKTHFEHRSEYRQTPAERKKAKERAAKERAKQEKEYAAFVAIVKKRVKPSLSDKAINVLLEYALDMHGVSSMFPIARRLKLKLGKEKSSWGGEHNSYKPAFREYLKKVGKNERVQLAFELLLEKRDRNAAKSL